jgi:hypothetical protein
MLAALAYGDEMPKGPQGQKRPADAIGCAIMVGRIAAGEIEDPKSPVPKRAEGGKVGGKRRAEKLSTDEKRQIAKKAANARWGNTD